MEVILTSDALLNSLFINSCSQSLIHSHPSSFRIPAIGVYQMNTENNIVHTCLFTEVQRFVWVDHAFILPISELDRDIHHPELNISLHNIFWNGYFIILAEQNEDRIAFSRRQTNPECKCTCATAHSISTILQERCTLCILLHYNHSNGRWPLFDGSCRHLSSLEL
ncbi:hypothetical protein BLNAU_6522 [Blattamonas nauphoetae]|uniref:Uncharacterized protein n=1 Tax=Blattamonas nauphoetae TaxID=2049346 RepID=A0ABQ9WVE7_9EUKA|nr:hypothetical protein BLNAU_24839 [Blattamonas nauphoetae]KAK2942049.1 hypothetical protein BLNAU_23040 [Blattamonas nauphoetae]KAK2942401.1 hypothetical protein BLNAU_22689 [Blattamonas nauphoetae]KAK2957284.1 hypothetical protein BLNAU_7662 [Blattamonas nauphoetae]KAK2958488.1 hypothetical protein BLNAU_6522 [Blattamonas nauphoetae]